MVNKTFPLILSLALVLPTVVLAQFTDDFSDGDFTNSPVWSGDASLFTIDNQQLRSNSAGAATYYLSTESTASADVQWQFFFDFQFGTSGANFCDVFLMADNANLNNANNGYFVRIGGTTDEISLYSLVGGTENLLIDGDDGLVNSSSANPFVIKVSRTLSNDWRLEYDDGVTGTFVLAGTANNNAVNASTHFGVLIEQSTAASPVNGHFFDDFSVGSIPVDNTLPELSSVTVLSNTELELTFSEPVDATTAETAGNYTADNGLGNPSAAVLNVTDPTIVTLTFGQSFVNGTTYQLTASNVQDIAGNAMLTAIEPFTYIVPSAAGFRDVVINEFMCDPTPFVGLPDAEFIEVFNTSQNFIDLTGWKVGDASSFGTVGSHIIGPNEYAVLISTTDEALFAFVPNAVTVTSFPSLNNSGDDIILQDANEVVIDQLSYDLSWYRDENKEDGGYTLEQINPFASCVNAANWSGSEDPNGGTPSVENAVYDDTPDTEGPTFSGIEIIDTDTVQLQASEALGLLTATNFTLSPTIGVSNASLSNSSTQLVDIAFDSPLDSGVVYTLTISGIPDCEGNIQVADTSIEFVVPFTADSGNYAINEVLFNPYTGGSDYVELVNITDRPLNLKNWMLANYDDEDGLSNFKSIITGNYSVPPGGYVLITEDAIDVRTNYINHGIDNFIEADMPSYNNDSGTVYLLNADSIITESFSYDEDMHFALLNDVNGVSLERLDFNRPATDMGNWHSAAETVGFGTPGLVNSLFYPTSEAVGEVSVDPEIFSPNGDEIDPVANINYAFTTPGFVATIRIYDANGRLVRVLASNDLLASEGTFTWDGITDKGEKARIGAYIILFEAFSDTGAKSVHKLSVILGGRI